MRGYPNAFLPWIARRSSTRVAADCRQSSDATFGYEDGPELKNQSYPYQLAANVSPCVCDSGDDMKPTMIDAKLDGMKSISMAGCTFTRVQLSCELDTNRSRRSQNDIVPCCVDALIIRACCVEENSCSGGQHELQCAFRHVLSRTWPHH